MNDEERIERISAIHVAEARRFVAAHHYNKVMPRLTKLCVGGYSHGELVAVATFGYGVRPVHTLRGLFPSLSVPEYLEIGRLCVDDRMPRNTESHFMSLAFRMVKRTFPHVKVIYSWADGIVGKPGYVYQASNFYYGGFIWTEMYLSDTGTRVHPRTMQGISTGGRNGKHKTRDFATTTSMGFRKYWGLQFRYALPICHKQEWKRIVAESPVEWRRDHYPKDVDCRWQIQVALGCREECAKPPFVSNRYIRRLNTAQEVLPL